MRNTVLHSVATYWYMVCALLVHVGVRLEGSSAGPLG